MLKKTKYLIVQRKRKRLIHDHLLIPKKQITHVKHETKLTPRAKKN